MITMDRGAIPAKVKNNSSGILANNSSLFMIDNNPLFLFILTINDDNFISQLYYCLICFYETSFMLLAGRDSIKTIFIFSNKRKT